MVRTGKIQDFGDEAAFQAAEPGKLALYRPLDGAGVSRFDPVCLWLRDDSAPILAHWVQGMRGAQSGPPDPEPYNTFRYRREPLGDTLRLVGGRRSAELDTAWIALELNGHPITPTNVASVCATCTICPATLSA